MRTAPPLSPRCQSRKRGRRLDRVLPALGMMVGIALLAAPLAMDVVTSAWAGRQVTSMSDRSDGIDPRERRRLLSQARSYNCVLAGERTEIPTSEIWDYEQGMHITNIQPPFLVLDLCFADDGCLMYRHYAPAYNTELVKKWAVDAPAPDETVVEMLESLTSCELDENLVPVIKDPAFAQDLGSWATVFK